MSKLFYDHLIVINEVHDTLLALKMSDEDHFQTLEVIDETVHHHVLDIILTHLPKEHHESFLERITKAPHDKTILKFLNEKSKVAIEDEITKAIKSLKAELLELIKQHSN